MATKKAPATLPEGITKAHVKKAVLTVQAAAPKAPGKSKLQAALALIALFAGIAGATIPNAQVKAISEVVGLTVAGLQASGEFSKDKAPAK
jgi:hypothetical protein